MPKLKILVTIKNEEENTSYEVDAIIQDNILKYKENNNTMVLYNYDRNILTRENEELRMDYVFDIKRKTKGTIQVKEINQKVDIDLKTNKLERKNNDIEVHFSIDDKDFLYRIEEIK